ncbi:MAG: hypothetical protein R6X34_20450 [Chloroflexota bacterium]
MWVLWRKLARRSNGRMERVAGEGWWVACGEVVGGGTAVLGAE